MNFLLCHNLPRFTNLAPLSGRPICARDWRNGFLKHLKKGTWQAKLSKFRSWTWEPNLAWSRRGTCCFCPFALALVTKSGRKLWCLVSMHVLDSRLRVHWFMSGVHGLQWQKDRGAWEQTVALECSFMAKSHEQKRLPGHIKTFSCLPLLKWYNNSELKTGFWYLWHLHIYIGLWFWRVHVQVHSV